MTCQVEFTDTAERGLSTLDRTAAQQVLVKLRWLADNAESASHKALTGQWKGVFSLRVGDYRAIYQYDRADCRVVVHFVKHRSKVYHSHSNSS